MDVSIIIVAWNVRDYVQKCLESVFKETKGIEFEVIYVDNASEDGSVEMVRNEFPEVRIIENKENRGFNKANNQGIKIAQGRYILLLNSDTVVLDNAIAKTVKFADEHPDAGIVGCKVLNPDLTLQRTCFMYPSLLNMFLSATYLNKLFARSRFFGRERMTWWDFNDVRVVETVCGCFSLIRRKGIDENGLMDERYFMYGDDPDLCFRFKQRGWKAMFTPDLKIIHYGGQTTKQMKREFRWQLHGGVLLFMRLHRPRIQFPLVIFFNILYFLIRVPVWILLGVVSSAKRKDAFYTVGTYILGAWFCLTNWKKLLINEVSL